MIEIVVNLSRDGMIMDFDETNIDGRRPTAQEVTAIGALDPWLRLKLYDDELSDERIREYLGDEWFAVMGAMVALGALDADAQEIALRVEHSYADID